MISSPRPVERQDGDGNETEFTETDAAETRRTYIDQLLRSWRGHLMQELERQARWHLLVEQHLAGLPLDVYTEDPELAAAIRNSLNDTGHLYEQPLADIPQSEVDPIIERIANTHITKSPNRQNDPTCTICHADFATDEVAVVLRGCCHEFHRGCLSDHIRSMTSKAHLPARRMEEMLYVRCPNCNDAANLPANLPQNVAVVPNTSQPRDALSLMCSVTGPVHKRHANAEDDDDSDSSFMPQPVRSRRSRE